ncbi:MAG: restriction endonuclease subunit S [Candidatus Sericytochromatia bacterium]|nr:restriction endonuclease subunit S [Candidatus Sericytochromatia bacterium]
MKSEEKCLLGPRLRFPEFQDAGKWAINEFSKYIVLYRGSSPRPIQNYFSSDSNGVNWIKIGDTKFAKNFVISKVEEKITPEGAKKSRKVNTGELILANSMSYGKTYQVAIDGCIYDGWFVLRDYEKYFDKQFLLQLLNSDYMQSQYEKFSAGGIVQNISSEIVYKTLLPHTSQIEQQKIADCLSSLDTLISAQTQKIDTLKTHKKGLMQQIFPSEGETIPRLRFPVFRDGGDWRTQRIEELAKRGSGHTPDKKKASYYSGGIKWVSLADSNMLDNGYLYSTKIEISTEGLKNSSAVLHPVGTVILSRDAGVGKSAILNSDMAVSQHFMAWVCDKSKLSNWFLYYVLQILKPTFESIAVGSTIKTIGLPYFKALCISVPSIEEQQKIADCLSSLDILISAQTQKLDALKIHKKGLMQLLFPALEADA